MSFCSVVIIAALLYEDRCIWRLYQRSRARMGERCDSAGHVKDPNQSTDYTDYTNLDNIICEICVICG
jgi:hypothetical protein